MTRDELIALLKARCKRSADTSLDATIVTELKFVQEQILEKPPIIDKLPWFLITDWTQFTITSNVDYVAVESALPGFLLEYEDGEMQYQDPDDATSWLEIPKAEGDRAESYYRDDDNSYPLVYSIVGSRFIFKPTPDQNYTARTKYYARDTVLSTNVENNWLKYAADVVLAETGKIIAGRYLVNAQLAAEFDADAKDAWKRLWDMDELRKTSNMPMVMQYGNGIN